MVDERTPVLIGAGQFTYKGDPASSPSPSHLLKIAAERAAEDAGIGAAGLAGLDSIIVAPSAIAMPGGTRSRGAPFSSNAAAQLGAMVGAKPRWAAQSANGGNSSQYIINRLAERIAAGETDLGLAVGCEVLGSVSKRMAKRLGFEDWEAVEDLSLDPPPVVGDTRPGVSPYEARHGLDRPINIYPIFENALRARDGRSLADHAKRMGALFERFTAVAAENPHAWFPIRRSAEELTTVTERNRMIGFPYPKLLNAIMEVDQSAGVLIASVKRARELGVPENRWVYLRGYADAHDIWHILERQNFHSSPAMRLTGQRAMEMAGIGPDDLKHIDLYSCFPSAVQVGAEELGIPIEDARGFTVTGGLPYAGGPGNNYAMHSAATMVQKLRDAPGAYGLVTANGWYLTKQSTGIYSTTPPDRPFARQDGAGLQREIDALPHPDVTETPQGTGTIETYTVVHKREGPFLGIVIGRDANGRRFAANTPGDPATLNALEASEQIGRKGTLSQSGPLNIFTPQ